MMRLSTSILRRASLAIFFLRLSQGSGQSHSFDPDGTQAATGAGDGLALENVADGHGHHDHQKHPEGDQKDLHVVTPYFFDQIWFEGIRIGLFEPVIRLGDGEDGQPRSLA